MSPVLHLVTSQYQDSNDRIFFHFPPHLRFNSNICSLCHTFFAAFHFHYSQSQSVGGYTGAGGNRALLHFHCTDTLLFSSSSSVTWNYHEVREWLLPLPPPWQIALVPTTGMNGTEYFMRYGKKKRETAPNRWGGRNISIQLKHEHWVIFSLPTSK